MNRYQEKAWNMLSEDERVALTLQLGHHKSTWQAGEIMGKAHYKYIEIQERAQYLFKRLTDHFKVYNTLIPSECKLTPEVKSYFKMLLIERVKPGVVINKLNSPILNNPKKRNELIKNQLNWLENSNKTLDLNILGLIKDYDRWNNFRILPVDCQEASAFKRRNKNRTKKDIKNFMEVEEFSIKIIIDKYSLGENFMEAPIFYVPLFIWETQSIDIIKISREESVKNKISTAGLYIFSKMEEAQTFSELASEYYLDRLNKTNDCKKGLKFWPKFRLCIEKAINYSNIQNLVNSRKHIRYCLKEL